MLSMWSLRNWQAVMKSELTVSLKGQRVHEGKNGLGSGNQRVNADGFCGPSHLPREGPPHIELPSICSLEGCRFSLALLSGAPASSGFAPPSVCSGPAAPDPICPPASSRRLFASTWAAAIGLGLTLRFLSSLWCTQYCPASFLLWFLKRFKKNRQEKQAVICTLINIKSTLIDVEMPQHANRKLGLKNANTACTGENQKQPTMFGTSWLYLEHDKDFWRTLLMYYSYMVQVFSINV